MKLWCGAEPQSEFHLNSPKGRKKVYILGLAQKMKRAFFLAASQKRKSIFILSASIREDPCLMLYRFNPGPQRKIMLFWIFFRYQLT